MPLTLYVGEMEDGHRVFVPEDEVAPGRKTFGKYIHFERDECLKRWPRLCRATAGVGYWTDDEVANFVRDYRWFKALGDEVRARLYLRQLLFAFKTRHISKQCRAYFAKLKPQVLNGN